MINKLSWIISETFNPYHNLALEKYLFDTVKDDEIILYLWQNKQTVVCGRNQNIWKECQVSKLIEEGGYPARRLSGGGAVFHDLGNLNFTFLVTKENYCLEKQLAVICNACQSIGINAICTGRNDITVDGRKFSGNAFYEKDNKKYHHGTLMISVDKNILSLYLNVDKSKLASKGVNSVKSRVANLSEFNSEITIGLMKELLINAFSKTYGLPATEIDKTLINESDIKSNEILFQSNDWLYEKNMDFNYQINRRFVWGDFDLNIKSSHGKIQSLKLYSDANDEAFIRRIAQSLNNCIFSYYELCKHVDCCCETDEQNNMAKDIKMLLYESI